MSLSRPLIAEWLLLLPIVATGQAPIQTQAQGQGPAWQGEWGSFHRIAATGFPQFTGRGLSIDRCAAGQCSVHLIAYDRTSNGEASGNLDIQSATSAIAHLSAFGQEHCSLRLTLAPEKSAITAAANSGDCSYFETPGATFLATYPLRTRTVFHADDVPACFAATEPTETALCSSPTLAAQQSQWKLLYLEVAELAPGALASGTSELSAEENAQRDLFNACNPSPNPEECLTAAFTRSTAGLNQRKAAWQQSVTAPGDPALASSAATAIAGTYRQSFANGDVQGDHFRSTDTLTITRLHNNAIHYDLYLEFYNGHQCSIAGTATWRSAGFFVDQKPAEMPKAAACFFEIRPTGNGVHFADPTGGCKMLSCGERGGYNGAQFSFKDRKQP